MRSASPRSLRRGFGLLEVILVFALVIGASAVVFAVFQSAQPSDEAHRANSSLTVLAANIRGVYAVGGDYSSISAPLLIKNSLVPKDLIAASGTSIIGFWQKPITVQAYPDSHHFTIFYEGVPQDACSKFVLGTANYFSDVSMGPDLADINTVIRADNGVIDVNSVVTACGSSPTVALAFTSR